MEKQNEETATLKVYKASAGSGKTFRLVVEYVKLLIANPEVYANILAVTFTNKATCEMKNRILSELNGIANGLDDSKTYLTTIQKELSQGEKKWSYDEIRREAKKALSSILHNYSRFRIETIDSFFQSILKNLAKELGLGAYMNIELDNNSVLTEAIKELFNKVKEDKDLMDWISEYINERLDKDKDWKLDQELQHFGRNLFREDYKKKEQEVKEQGNLIMKDKEALKNYRKKLKGREVEILQGVVNLARRFKETLEANDLETDSFAFGKSGVAGYFDKILSQQNFVEAGSRIIKCLGNTDSWVTKTSQRREAILALIESDLLGILAETIDYQEKHARELNTISLISKDLNKVGLMNDIAVIITKLNNANNQFMLADTPTLLNRMIEDCDAPFIYEKVGAYIQHIMIDEFQDTSLTQWENFKPLLMEGLSQNALSLIVGDPKQSIYRWRNSDWRTISNIKEEIRSSKVATIPMDTNWRSEHTIIDFNNRLFESTLPLIDAEKTFKNMQKAYEDVFQKCSKQKNEGWVFVKLLPTSVVREEMDDSGEPKTVTDNYETIMTRELIGQIEQLQEQGIKADEITILVRKNKNIPLIAQALSDYSEKSGTKHNFALISDEAYKLESSLAIQIIIQALQYISEPENELFKVQLAFSYQTEILKMGADNVEGNTPSQFSFNSVLEEKLKDATLLPLYEMVEEIYQTLDLYKIKGQECYMHSFLDGLNDFLVNRSSDLSHFLRHWEEKMKETTIPFSSEINGIKIMSIHKSKGLEFHTVIIPFCDWTLTYEQSLNPLLWCTTDTAPYGELPLLPITHGEKMKNSFFEEQYLEENEQLYVDNLNILYVALTRAKKNLILLGKNEEETEKKKVKKEDDPVVPKNVSDLLKQTLRTDDEHWDPNSHTYSTGTIYNKQETEKEVSQNVLKQKPSAITFEYQAFKQKAKFRQSNDSRSFINEQGEEEETDWKNGKKLYYIERGKVLHQLFSVIKTADDVERAAAELEFKGVFEEIDKEECISKAKEALQMEKAQEWFAPGLELFNECEILYKREGKYLTCRPDRVIKRGNSMTVIDYKFGKEDKKHIVQVCNYIQLIREMGYEANGFIWYVEKGKIVEATE